MIAILEIWCPKGRAGSNPALGANSIILEENERLKRRINLK